MHTGSNPAKIDEHGRFVVYDSYSEEVERTNDLEYAKGRADANDGWVIDDRRDERAVIYDSED